MLVKRFIAVDSMGCITNYGKPQFNTKIECDEYITSLGIYGFLVESQEVDINTTPRTSASDKYVNDTAGLFEDDNDSGIVLKNFHLSLMPGYLAMSGDEKAKFLYDCLHPLGDVMKNAKPLDFNDRTIDQVDLSQPWDVVDGSIRNV